MIELCCEYLSVRCIWLYVIIMSCTSFRVNPHSSLAKWLSVCLQTKWLWVRISLLSLKRQIWHLLWARSSLTFRQTIECGFTLKLVRDMIITYRQNWWCLPRYLGELWLVLFEKLFKHSARQVSLYINNVDGCKRKTSKSKF